MKTKIISLILMSAFFLFRCQSGSEPTASENKSIILTQGFDSVQVNLKIDQSITINDELTIKFTEVPSDSRCPVDVTCIWAGNGEVKLALSQASQSKFATINTLLEPREITFGNYRIGLSNLNPAPKSDREIKPSDYNVDLVIKPALSNSKKVLPINLIDGSNSSIIKRDMLNVNSLLIDNDRLNFNLSYSGGCKEHQIELYAYNEIQKSNPAQVTVHLSHNANNDMCEAWITQNISFDLAKLKEYLKNNYGISDKVLLIIHDPSGKPIRNPVVEYKF